MPDTNTTDKLYTVATPANMREFERANPGHALAVGGRVEGRRCMALDMRSGNTFSATSGDYWQLADDEPICNTDGEPLILVVQVCNYMDALTDEVV